MDEFWIFEVIKVPQGWLVTVGAGWKITILLGLALMMIAICLSHVQRSI